MRAACTAHLRLAALCLVLCGSSLSIRASSAAQEPRGAPVQGSSGDGSGSSDSGSSSSGSTTSGPTLVRPRAFCHPGSAEALENSHTPLPCTPEQEQDALNDLFMEMPDLDDPLHAIIDSSSCNASDHEGFIRPVDLFDPDLMLVVTTIGDDFILAYGNDSILQSHCDGDLTTDPFNACLRVDPENQEDSQEPGVHYKIWMKLSCSSSSSDTIALEAYAFLSRQEGNETITVTEWQQIPLPGPGQ